MTHTELKKILRNAGIGAFWGNWFRGFDTEYLVPHFAWLNQLVKRVWTGIEMEGLTYAENGSDCDNFALWVQSDVTKEWAKQNKGKASFPALAFGRCLDPGHDLNIGATVEGVKVWNYGVYVPDWNLKDLREVEFK